MTDIWDGREKPGAQDLLEIARTTLLTSVIPQLAGDARFQALMVANAIAIARRDAGADMRQLAEAIDRLRDLARGDMRELSAQIRAGAHDPGTATHAAVASLLTRLAEARCRISAPKALA